MSQDESSNAAAWFVWKADGGPCKRSGSGHVSIGISVDMHDNIDIIQPGLFMAVEAHHCAV